MRAFGVASGLGICLLALGCELTPPGTGAFGCTSDQECDVARGFRCDLTSDDVGRCVQVASAPDGGHPVAPPDAGRDAGAGLGDAGRDGGGRPDEDAGATPDAGLADGGLDDGGLDDGGPLPCQAEPDSFPAPWHADGWQRRARLRFGNPVSTEAVTDFPVLVRLAPGSFVYECASTSGDDLRFFDADGAPLPLELERWDEAGESLAWVRVPVVDPASNSDHIWLYWGNPAAPAAASAEGPWDDAFRAVLHFAGSAPAGGELLNSAEPLSAPAVAGGGASPPSTSDGAVGAGLSFDTVDDEVLLPALHGEGFPQGSSTVSLWARATFSSRVAGNRLFDGEDGSRSHLFLRARSGGVRAGLVDTEGQATGVVVLEGDIDDDEWHHVALRVDASGSGSSVALFIDGVEADGSSLFTGFSPREQVAQIGATWDGLLDEIRVSSAARSPTWLRLEHLSAIGRLVVLERSPDGAPRPERELHSAAAPPPIAPVVRYDFDEGSGTVVEEQMGTGLDLQIADPAAVRWFEGGLRIQSDTLLSSTGPATAIHSACASSAGLAFEAWVRPESASLSGPARIVTMSLDHESRNFTLGQDDAVGGMIFRTRLRTSTTTANGKRGVGDVGDIDSPVLPGPPSLMHVVLVREEDGDACYFVDGQEVSCIAWDGDFVAEGELSWEAGYRIGVGNELSWPQDNRAWRGDLYHIAVYCQELSAEEVMRLFVAGPR